jgi:hypothetical protein
MKKATLQAAGTAVLGVAVVAAVAGPAAADPLGGLPQVSSLTGETSSLTAPNGGLHDVTSTAQGLINNTAPTVQGATSSLPVSSTRSMPRHRDGLPAVGGVLGGLPGADQLSGGTGHALDALHGLPVHAPSVG